jgi:uroporphyrinogen decarboxylase
VNRKERFLTAVRLQQPDRVPMFDFLFQQPMYEALIGRRPASYSGCDAVALALALDHDAVWLPFGGYTGFRPKMLADDIYVDEWGTTYRHTASSWPIDAPIDYPIKSRTDLARYRPPDPTLAGRLIELEIARDTDNDNLALLAGLQGPFTTAWLLMGYEQMSYALYDDPEMLVDLFRIANEYFKEAARLCARAGCDGMWLADDLGDSTRGFVKPDLFRRYVLPHIADLAETMADLGIPVLLHSCGHISDYLDDLAQTRISAVHPLQRTAGMDLRAFKENYGRRFAIIGNIDSSRTLPYGAPADVAAEVREAIDTAAPGGGFVLASDHSLHDGIPLDNIVEMFRVGREYGGSFYREELAECSGGR